MNLFEMYPDRNYSVITQIIIDFTKETQIIPIGGENFYACFQTRVVCIGSRLSELL